MIPQKRKTLATDLRSQVWIQQKQQYPDGEGGFVETWTDIRQLYCKIRSLTAEQLGQYKTIDVECDMAIDFRAESDITESNRILLGGRIFEILTIVVRDEMGIIKTATCRERKQ